MSFRESRTAVSLRFVILLSVAATACGGSPSPPSSSSEPTPKACATIAFSPTAYDLGHYVSPFAVSRLLTGTAKPDVIMPDLAEGVVRILPNKGDGTFGEVLSVAGASGGSLRQPGLSGNDTTRAVAKADLNGDGLADLLVAGEENGVWALLNNGDRFFRTPVPVSSSGSAFVDVGDFNGDGRVDVVLTQDGLVAVALGNGDGTFQAPRTVDRFFGSSTVAVGDIDGDRQLDAVTASFTMYSAYVLHGDGHGTLTRPTHVLAVGTPPRAVVVGDFNRDGAADIAAVGRHPESGYALIAVFLGNGDGTFRAPHIEQLGNGPADAMAASDVNGDGKPDLVVGGGFGWPTPGSILILIGHGDGTFEVPVNYDTSVETWSLVVSDVNGDGRPDVVAAGTRQVSVLLNTCG